MTEIDFKDELEESFVNEPNTWISYIEYVKTQLKDKLDSRDIKVGRLKYNIFCKKYLKESLKLKKYLKDNKKKMSDTKFEKKVIGTIILEQTVKYLKKTKS